MNTRIQIGIAALAAVMSTLTLGAAAPSGRWTEERAAAWQAGKPWLTGCNFIPSTAINELEMWQAETFDPATIDRELGWAQSIGFTSVRVFLHHLPWQQDPRGFGDRIDRFLGIAARHHIGVMFVLFDSCWDPFPKSGPQRAPAPGVHNSGWLQCPGAEVLKDPKRHDELAPYVKGVLSRFKDDPRVDFWDLFNEPDNNNASSYGRVELPDKADRAFDLLKKTFAWAREVNPSQPLSAAPWVGDWTPESKLSPINRFMFENSDIITFHNYGPAAEMRGRLDSLARYHRPVICTEYMCRPAGSTFADILPLLKERKAGAYNWGLVSGKTQTVYPWDSWSKKYTAEPALWFHDIFRPDGAPFDPKETALIKSLTTGR